LAACTLFISLSGMMVFDLLRNMWSWEQASPINSAIMDLILGLFG